MMLRVNMGRLGAKSVQPSIRSVELPGEHNYKNKDIYLSVCLTFEILSIKLQTATTSVSNNLFKYPRLC